MKPLLIAAAAACVCGHALAAGPEFKFSGFGTVGAVHSSEENADFIGNRFQPNGAGHTREWSTTPDTKLGLQLSAVFSPRWSAVVQVVSQHQPDNSFKPEVEWANVKFQATPEISLRVGRIAAPSYLLSESRFVGYANAWVRPPVEAYNVLAITSNDGVDATWRKRFGDVNNTLQVYYGKSSKKVGSGTEAESDPAWGLNNSVEVGSLTLRGGYTNIKLNLIAPSIPIVPGLQQFAAAAGAVPMPGFQTAAAQALALAQKYKMEGMKLSAISLGANYDPGDWFVMSELVAFRGDGLLSDSRSWYVSGGYRFGAFTPYVTFASTKAQIEREGRIDTSGAPPLTAGADALVAGINQTLASITGTQRSTSVGLRWDVMKNVALKTQYDRLTLGEGSFGSLKSIPGRTPDRSVDVFSVAADFVF